MNKEPVEKGGDVATPWLSRWIGWLGQFQFIVGVVFGIALAITSAMFWTREQARQAVSEPEFIHQLSRSIRPYMIVDSHKTVISDYGASDLLKDIKFEIPKNQSEMKIILSFKHHMPNPPLVQPMTRWFYFSRAERGEMHDWVIWMRVAPETVLSDNPSEPGPMTMQLSSLDPSQKYAFLIEILN